MIAKQRMAEEKGRSKCSFLSAVPRSARQFVPTPVLGDILRAAWCGCRFLERLRVRAETTREPEFDRCLGLPEGI